MIPSVSLLAAAAGADDLGELHDTTIAVTGTAPQSASFSVLNNGKVTGSASDFGDPPSWSWLLSGSPDAFDVKMSPTTGAFDGGSAPINTWLSLSASYTWFISRTLLKGSSTVKATMQLRRRSTGEVVSSALLTLSANTTP